MMVIEKDNLAG